jgi:hypothetical protein
LAVKPDKSVYEPRLCYLTIAECKVRPLLEAAFMTGGRYGQLTELTVGDFNSDARTVTMRTRKGDGSVKTYHVSPDAGRC